MTKEEVKYFLKYGLEWLIPAGYEKLVSEVKNEFNRKTI